MFGFSFSELLVIAVIAVLFLGPEKLPETLVKMARFFKSFKNTINDAKSSFEQEIKLQELKEDAQKYKESLTKTTENVRKKLTFEELDEIKKTKENITDELNELSSNIQNPINSDKTESSENSENSEKGDKNV